MEQLVTSNFKLGIIAGGQLGKMLALAASNWDVKTYILDPDENCPAATICTNFTKGKYTDFNEVYQFGKQVDMLTFDIENINIDALLKLKNEGLKIYPEPEALNIIRDKGLQKELYLKHQIISPQFRLFESKEDIIEQMKAKKIKLPFVQKLRTEGYDGKGVAVIKKATDLDKLLEGKSIVEQMIDIKNEVSVIVARNRTGEIKCFPLVDMVFNQQANLVEQLICPANQEIKIEQKAKKIAEKIISKLEMTGILAVEFFIDTNNKIWVNEIAPRPHNSGHHTIESCITSQYEQHLRAILGFKLGSTAIKIPSVMINLLGEKGYEGKVKYEGLSECMAVEGVKIHIYGKKITKPFRKMGHITIIDKDISRAKIKAKRIRKTLKVKSW